MTSNRGRKPTMKDAKLISVYLDGHLVDKLDSLVGKYGNRSALARDILVEYLDKV